MGWWAIAQATGGTLPQPLQVEQTGGGRPLWLDLAPLAVALVAVVVGAWLAQRNSTRLWERQRRHERAENRRAERRDAYVELLAALSDQLATWVSYDLKRESVEATRARVEGAPAECREHLQAELDAEQVALDALDALNESAGRRVRVCEYRVRLVAPANIRDLAIAVSDSWLEHDSDETASERARLTGQLERAMLADLETGVLA